MRVVGAQLVATVLAAAGFLVQGWRPALAALSGGGVVALGTGVLALRLFAAGPAPAGTVLARLIVGNLLKWAVIAGGLYLAMVRVALPALPVMMGLIAALVPLGLGLGLGERRSDQDGSRNGGAKLD